MHAGLRRRAAPEVSSLEYAPDAGVTLVEVLIAIMLIGIVMSALATFFVTTLSVTNLQSARQWAAQLAGNATERVRALKGSAVADGRVKCAATTPCAIPVSGVDLGDMQEWDYPDGTPAALPIGSTPAVVNGISYGQNWYVGKCWQAVSGGDCDSTPAAGDVEFYRVIAAMTWPDRHCKGSVCSYVTSTLVSDAAGDPIFNSNQSALPPAADNPGNQVGEVSLVASLQLTASGGAPSLTWSAIGLPPGLTVSSAGVVSGTPTTVGTYPVTATITDAYGLVDTALFTWTISAAQALTNPGTQTSDANLADSLSMSETGGVGTVTWSATSLPVGMSINASTGVISGTPTVAGAPSVTVTAKDSLNASASTTFTWTVAAQLALARPADQSTKQSNNIPVTLQMGATGGTGGYTWSVVGSPFGPSSISSAGLISGTANGSAKGTYTVTVTVKDTLNQAATTTFFWTIT
jgi:prepilin-type N-terminal cleavage/methylation domain-containing protein